MAEQNKTTPRQPLDLKTLNVKNKPRGVETSGSTRVKSAAVPNFEPPAELVALPSHGLLYKDDTKDEDVLSGQISVRPMTHTEEKILTTSRLIKSGQALDMVYKNCIKSAIDPLDLLSTDRLFLMFWLRGISYGHNYTFSMRCPECDKSFKWTVDISKHPVKEITEELEEPIAIKLPRSGATVYYYLSRGRVEKKLREMRDKQLVSALAIDDTTTRRMILLTDRIITPEGEELKKNKWEIFLDSLIGEDAATIRDDMIEKDAGVEPIKDIECPYCESSFDSNIPVTVDFFRVA